MDAEVALFFNRAAGDADAYNSDGSPAGEPIGPCHSCGFDLMLRQRDGQAPFVACAGGPSCKEKVYLPRATQTVSVSEEHCQDCHHGIVHKLNIRCCNLVYHLSCSTSLHPKMILTCTTSEWPTGPVHLSGFYTIIIQTCICCSSLLWVQICNHSRPDHILEQCEHISG